MRFTKSRIPAALLLSATLVLAGCQSVEERVAEHYRSALALAEEGDIDRAIVELRNVFRLEATNVDARRKMAELLLEQGNRQGAYRQYLHLAEQDRDDLESRIILSEMAFLGGNWEELDRHGLRLAELAPEDPRVEAITLVRDYRDAVIEEDAATLRDLGHQADGMLEAQPESPILRNVLIDRSMREQDFTRALAEVDWMIAYDPTNGRSYQDRLRILAQLGDMEAIEAQLRDLVEIFPDNPLHKAELIRFHISRGDLDAAEDFLRELVAEADPEDPGPALDLIRFLVELRGVDAARAEIERVVADHPDPAPFLTIGAGLDFSEGRSDEAITTLETLLDGAEPSEQMRDIEVTLARMLMATGDEAGARDRVDEVLAEQGDHPGALKMQAAWQIEADDTDAAIGGLRVALDQNGDDAEALTLMANAYARAGQTELTRDFLARAVQASDNSPVETLRLARLLMSEESYLPAEDLLLDALRRDRTNLDVLNVLGEVYLRLEDFGRAQSVADTLRRIDSDTAEQSANRIEAEVLNRRGGVEEALAFLQELGSAEGASLATRISLVRAQLNVGDPANALALARALVEEFPEEDSLTLVLAVTHVSNGDLETAISLYTDFLDETPKRPDVWLELARLHQLQEDRDVAKAVIDEGLSHTPEAENLLWARASFLLQDGEVDQAIEVYERLYAQNSGSVVVANNLASLLSTYRDDAESLERAWTIARRFRDAEAPALQDTYGWILHRRGNSAEARRYLEAAAEGLPNEPLIKVHLGQVYAALERPADARAQFARAVELAAPTDTRPQIEETRALLRSLPQDAGTAEN